MPTCLKILIVGDSGEYNLAYFYIKAFEDLGHQVKFVNQYQGVRFRFIWRYAITRFNSKILQEKNSINTSIFQILNDFEPDTILIFKGELISTQTLKFISDNYKMSLFYGDALRYKNSTLKGRLGYFKSVFSQGTQLDEFKKLGAQKVVTIPFACEPSFHKYLNLPKIYPIVFIGTFYPERYSILNKLERKNSLNVFGNHWILKPGQVNDPVYGENYVKTINSSLISLNIHNKSDFVIDGPNMKTFEILGCGSLLVTDKVNSMGKYFSKSQYESYGDIEELNEIVEYFIDNPEEAKEIGIKAREQCLLKHTYSIRAKEVLKNL